MSSSTSQSFSTAVTHDLWVQARGYRIDVSRSAPTTLNITITYDKANTVAKGAVVLLSSSPLNAMNYPTDGKQYVPSADFTAPADTIGSAQVVGFYSEILLQPFPDTSAPEASKGTFTVEVQNVQDKAILYASVHPSSNILQYYPIGVQSYPLTPTVGVEQSTSSYTGNIPSFSSAPTAPTPGLVYFDTGLNIIQFYDGNSSSWVPTRGDAIVTGAYNPGVLGQVYWFAGASSLMIFNGKKWTKALSSNLSFRVTNPSPSFVPVSTMTAGTTVPPYPTVGEFFYNYITQRAQYFDGDSWIFPNASNTLFSELSITTPCFATPLTIEGVELPDPYVGELFYNSSSKSLNAFNGVSWNKVNTKEQGIPSSDKTSIGTNGNSEQRASLMNVVKAQLGWPQYCVELDEFQFNIAIQNALDTYRQLSDGAYTLGYILFSVQQNQQLYYLNGSADNTDRIVSVSKIHRLNVLGLGGQYGQDSVFMNGFVSQYYSPNAVDMLSMHMFQALSEDFERVFAGNYTYLWNEATRELNLTRRVQQHERVILECILERSEQELLQDRWCKQFMQNWAVAEAKYMLGMIRSKYSSGTPGAAGTINLNGDMLISESRQDFAELKQSLLDYEHGGHIGQGNTSFLIG